MMRAFILGLILSLHTLFAHAAGETLSYERFSLMTDREKDQVIILTMKFMAEMEEKIERKVTHNSEWRRLRDFFLSEAYAAPLKNWRDYSLEYSTLLKKQNSVQCVYAGWVSKVVGGYCVQPSTLPASTPEHKTYVSSGGCGAGGTSEIACNPVIFGFKEAQKGSLFCVPAGAKEERAHNSSLRCMEKALNSNEGDSREARLKYLRDQLSKPENKSIIEDVYRFLNKACLCPEKVPGLAPKYEEYMQPHRTCYSLMRMLAETVVCSDPSKEIMDTTFFREIKNLSTPQGLSNKAFDEFYARFLRDLRNRKSSEIQALCQSDESNAFLRSGIGLVDGKIDTRLGKLELTPGKVDLSQGQDSSKTDDGDIGVTAKTCKATCYVPAGKKGDPNTPMDCYIAGIRGQQEDDELIDGKVSVPQVVDGKPATYASTRLMTTDTDGDGNSTKIEKQIDCKISGIQESTSVVNGLDLMDLKNLKLPAVDFGAIPDLSNDGDDGDDKDDSNSGDPTIDVKVKNKLQNNITFTAEVKGSDGKSGIPDGWDLVWVRKNVPKTVLLPKPKNPASSDSDKPSKNDALKALEKVESDTSSESDDKPSGDKPAGDKPAGDKPAGDKPPGDKPPGDKPAGDKPPGDKPAGDKSSDDKASGDKSSDDKPEASKVPEGAFDKGETETTQPRASQDYDICASLVKGSKKIESCKKVDKLQVNPGTIGGPAQMPLQGITPGAFSAGGVQ